MKRPHTIIRAPTTDKTTLPRLLGKRMVIGVGSTTLTPIRAITRNPAPTPMGAPTSGLPKSRPMPVPKRIQARKDNPASVHALPDPPFFSSILHREQ